nr:transposase [Streptomyces sp. NRRL S-1448]
MAGTPRDSLMDAAVNQLRADGFDVRDEDVARLSPFVRHHIDMLGRYSFQLRTCPEGCVPCATRAPAMRSDRG